MEGVTAEKKKWHEEGKVVEVADENIKALSVGEKREKAHHFALHFISVL